MKKDDEIMAEYLLKGGKMLSTTCPVCGSPLFEVKGETVCVVCREHGRESGTQTAAQDAAAVSPAPGVHSHTGTRIASGERLDGILEETLVALCERIRDEKRPEDCLTLMECIRMGIEARTYL
ncbi:MAG: hypothetical protein APR53_02485 [Methanoculleus sp. SDB]|nr:MAG: hypothetical protein APR53_02485 [Methanoculleus sp. SDB]